VIYSSRESIVRRPKRMHFVDLTPYTYSSKQDDTPTMNIGWLDIAVPFERGSVPAGFVERLKTLIQNPYARTRGFHACQFCDDLQAALHCADDIERKLYEDCHADGRFSSAEIRVRGKDGRQYAAPRMIAHYVEVHGYKPPEEFIEAVMQGDR